MSNQQLKIPSPTTLARYGFGFGPAALADTPEDDWRLLLRAHKGSCGACGRFPPSGRLNIDHEHVKNWVKMPPEERRIYVRGLACYMCNHYRLARGANPENLRGAADYLERYLKRIAGILGTNHG